MKKKILIYQLVILTIILINSIWLLFLLFEKTDVGHLRIQMFLTPVLLFIQVLPHIIILIRNRRQKEKSLVNDQKNHNKLK